MDIRLKGYESWVVVKTEGSLTTIQDSTDETRLLTFPTVRLIAGTRIGAKQEGGPSVRNRVLDVITKLPMTCDELEVSLQLLHQTASATLRGLEKEGLVYTDGKRETRTGSKAKVYHVVNTLG